MKIVHVETGRHFYGGAQQVVWLLTGLKARGIDCRLVCPPDSAINAVAREAQLDVVNIRCAGDHDLGFAFRLRRFLNSQMPDLVHCHSRRGADLLGGFAAAMAGVPAVLSRRVDSAEKGFMSSLRYRPFALVIAISDHIATNLAALPAVAGRVATIRSAVDVARYDEPADRSVLQEYFDIGEEAFAIAVVAQMIPRKGHRYLLDVVPNLRDIHPNVRIVLFGEGRTEAELKAMSEHMNLSGTVQFAGYRDDLDDYLPCFDLLVHPAVEEGLGVAILKAAAAGLPVIAFDNAGVKEAVAHGKTGVLVPPKDLHTLQKAIALMIDDTGMRREMGRAGKQRMRDKFSVQQMVDEHLKAYAKVLNG